MERMSRPGWQLRDHYSVVVVGSGYGGAIAASRLARAGQDVCVLERGREIHPGQYPDTLGRGLREMRARTPLGDIGRQTGLFHFHLDRDMSVLVGCGLGGTSLINANVALRADRSILADPRWPEPLREPGALAPYYARAERMLSARPYPDDWPDLPKLAALGQAATALGGPLARPPINVTFQSGPNAAEVHQDACVLCGDCVSGCNHGAKNTVLMNYLPDAFRHGADVFTEVEVRTVQRRGDGSWVLAVDPLGAGRPRFGGPCLIVTADVVVLAAGTLGSTEILLRSRQAGLALSDKLGERFSGNGDVLAFAYDVAAPVHGVGFGRRRGVESPPVGPCITGVVDLVPRRGFAVEEGSLPGALAGVLPALMWLAAAIVGKDPVAGLGQLARRVREAAAVPLGAYRGALDRTLTYLLMSEDDADGRLVLAGDRAVVDWKDVGSRPVFSQDEQTLREATQQLSGTFVPDPLWSTPLGHAVITVHPLGGCVMGDDATRGVVNHKGQVFAGPSGSAVHEGLYVTDGAVVPRALDVNPLLTISALAERASQLIADDRGWVVDLDGGRPAPAPVPAPISPAGPRVRFSERMKGFFSRRVTDGYWAGWAQGRADGSSIEFVLTIEFDDLEEFLRDGTVPGRPWGTVVAPALSPHPLKVTDGAFVLVDPDPDRVETWRMRYRLELVSQDGTRVRFDGVKDLHQRPGLNAWSDTTTLYVTVSGEGGETLGVGVMRIDPIDFARQLSTIEVLGVAEEGRRRSYELAFGRLFAGYLLRVYGGPLDEARRFPAVLRPIAEPGRLRREPPVEREVRWCGGAGRWHEGSDSGDDAWLRLTRYRGGSKGPLLLASGFGMSAGAFLLDTIEVNLTEYLVGHGYDVWLFDYRAAIDLPSSRSQFTIDAIATMDWPTAIAEVRRVTGAPDVQAYGHCVGSASLLMALGAGTAGGVRSAVCAQFPLHPVTSRLNRTKADLHVSRLLADVGLRVVSPDTRFTLPNVVLDLALRAVPMAGRERCGQAACRWINAIYGCTHSHAQLNEATHVALNELFGVGNVTSLGHLARMMQRSLAVAADGSDAYTAHPERLRIPLHFLQGAENYIFHPEGSRRTLAWLCAANGPDLYSRTLLPGYAHLDAVVGRNAAREVYPRILEHFERTA